MVDPIGILLELGFDLDDISTDEGYLSALKEAIATIEFKTGGSGDEISSALREEVKKVKGRRKNKAKGFVSPAKLAGSPNSIPVSSIVPRDSEVEPEEPQKKPVDFMAFLTNVVAPSLTRIEASLENIIGLMSQDQKQDKKSKEKARISKDKAKKQGREEKNETIPKILGGIKDRVVAPVKSIFDRIVEFFTTIGLGILAIEGLKILSDPAGYFGPMLNPFIDFLNGTIKIVWNVINPIYGLVNTLNLAIRTLEAVVNNTIGNIPGVPELDLPEISGIAEPPQIPRIETPKEENIPGMAEGGIVNNYTTDDTVNNYTTIQNMSEGGPVTESTGEKITGMGADTQMVALEPGEVVMSRKAVDEYGADTLLGMNADAGGTNVPSMGKVQGFQGGGTNRPSMGKVQGFQGGGMVGGDMSQYSTEQLKGMLDPTMMGKKNPAVFQAAKSARQLAKQQGLTPQQTERVVLESTVKASRSSSPTQHQGAPDRSRTQSKPQQPMVPGSNSSPDSPEQSAQRKRVATGARAGYSEATNVPEKVKDDTDFQSEVSRVAKSLNVPEDYMYAIMSFETGGSFDTSQKNMAGSGATGLIQFMPSTAEGLGTTTEELAQMSRSDQMKYVEKYLGQNLAGRMDTKDGAALSDFYMSVLYPVAVGKPENYALFKQGSREYAQNAGLDKDGDGIVTKAEAAAKVMGHLDPESKVYESDGTKSPQQPGQPQQQAIPKALPEPVKPKREDYEFVRGGKYKFDQALKKYHQDMKKYEENQAARASAQSQGQPQQPMVPGVSPSGGGSGGGAPISFDPASFSTPNADPSTWSSVNSQQNMLQPSDMILDASDPGFGMISPPSGSEPVVGAATPMVPSQSSGLEPVVTAATPTRTPSIKPGTMSSPPKPPSRGGGGKGGISTLPIPSGGGQSAPVGATNGGSSVPNFSPIDQSNPERLVVKAMYNILG